MSSLLEVRGLHVWFDLEGGGSLHAVQGVGFELHAGERFGLVGESGCGKTTSILALMGLLPPSAAVSGEILLEGTDILARGEASMQPHRWRDVAMVFQGAMNALNPVRTVGSQIVEPMELHGISSGSAARSSARELLEMVGIPGAAAERYPHEFSGGMRQRAAIAMALACGPKVLLADEPTTALDVMVQAQILELLVRLTEELGLALVLVTHDLPVVAQVCERAAVMYAGEIVERSSVDALFHSPRHPYTRLLFAATPDLYGREEVLSIPGAPPPLDRDMTGCPFEPRCDRAFDRCPHDRPLLKRVEAGHWAACHLNDLPAQSQVPSGAELGGPITTAGLTQRDDRNRSEAQPTILKAEELVTRYPVRRSLAAMLRRQPRQHVRAVDGISFELRRSEMLALVGESGCGKTSTAQTVLRLIHPVSGSIHFLDQDITHLSHGELRPLRRKMQIIYQDPYESLDPRFRVRQTIEEPLVIHGVEPGKQRRRQRVLDALARVELTPPEFYADRYPHELSGGQRQRVAIAASLVLEPRLLVADEPVSMLDVSVRAGVLALLDKLRRTTGMGILMITHDLSTAAHFADRIAVMYLGRIVEEGPSSTVVNNPQHPYTRALLSVVPKRDPRERTTPQILEGETPNPIHIPVGCRFHPRCPMAVPRCKSIDPQLEPPAAAETPEHRAACILV